MYRTILQDIRFGLRMMARDKGASVLMILSLALAMGACVAVYSLIDAILFRPLPGISDPSALVALYGDDRSTPHVDYGSLSYPDYLDFTRSIPGFSGLTAYCRYPVTLVSGDDARRITGELVTSSYFSVLGVRLQLGRPFEEDDDSKGAVPAVVIADRLWKARFGGDPKVIGRRIKINQLEARIIGVGPEGFGGVLLDWHGRADIWLPLHFQSRLFGKIDLMATRIPWLMCMGRQAAGASLKELQTSLNARAAEFERAYPDTNRHRDVVAIRANQARFYPARRQAVASVLSLLLIGALTVLFIACFNTAALLLARGEKRSVEMSVRMALGGSKRRLAAQLVTESLLIAFVSAVLSLFFAFCLTWYLPSIGPMFHLDFEARQDGRVAGMLLLTTVLSVLVFGLYPALRTSAVSVAPGLRAGIGRHASTFALRRVVLVGQITLTVVVLLTGTLFFRQLRHLGNIDPGFNLQAVTTIRVDAQAVPEGQREAAYIQLLDLARSFPGTGDACLSRSTPLSGSIFQIAVRFSDNSGEDRRVAFAAISKDYFRVLGLPLIRGRTFGNDFAKQSEVIVNEVLARQEWPGEDPVGRRLLIGTEQTPHLVVGVARTSKTVDLTEDPRPFLYVPLREPSFPEVVLLTRSSVPFADLVSSVQAKIRQDMPKFAVLESAPLSEMVRSRLSVERTLAQSALAIGALALVLVFTGLLGVLTLLVSQRSRDMAIRLALGASPYVLFRWVLSQAMVLGFLGLVAGSGLGFILIPFISAQLRGQEAVDPITYLAVSAFILAICTVASLAPALRVIRIAPAEALRAE